MQSHYEINISKKGIHFFATDPRSCVGEYDLEKILPTILEKFPESEGYKVSVTWWETKGTKCQPNDLLPQSLKVGMRVKYKPECCNQQKHCLSWVGTVNKIDRKIAVVGWVDIQPSEFREPIDQLEIIEKEVR